MDESFNKNIKSNKKPELGSFEIKKSGTIIPRNISLGQIFKNEEEYKGSKERFKAINDLLETWNYFFIDEVSNNVKKALKSPKSFEEFVDNFPDSKDNDFNLKDFLENILLEFKTLMNSFNTIKEKFLDNRLDFKDTDDIDLNDELKFKLENKINWVNEKSKILEDLIKYTESKINKLLY